MPRLRVFALLITAIVFLGEAPVHAYIDPGSTSLLLQGLLGGIAAVLVATRTFWQGLLGRLRKDKSDSDAAGR